jgi:glycosyltransferase involved in cell wall biosynthesis
VRILQITDCYPPPFVGGRELQVRVLAQELLRRGHEVEVATLAGRSGPHTELDGDITVHRVAGWNRALRRFYADPEQPWHPTIPDPGVVRVLFNLIRERKPQVVHAHSWMLHSLLPFLPSLQTRLVVTMHEYGLVCPKNSFVHRGDVCDGPRFAKCVACAADQYGMIRSVALTSGLNITRRLRRRVDRYIAISACVAQACEPLALDCQQQIDIIPPFLPDDCFDLVDTDRPRFVPATGEYIMFAGALSPHKGIDVLLEAYRGIDSAIPLVLLGLRRNDSPKNFPDDVIVVENVPHNEVMRAWKNCTVAIAPSRWPEPWGLVALEAMCTGRPVVASATGGLQTLVEDGRTGIQVPPGDVPALRAGIRRLLNDPGERFRMGEAGRARAEGYRASELVPKIEQVYQEVTDSSRSDAGKHRYGQS